MPNNRNANGIVNPYGAGDVRLDSTPYTRFYLQQEAHKKAKDEALDKYFGDMEKNLTPTGMRTVDVPLLIEGKRKAQTYWLANKRTIKNPDLDNGKSLLEYSKFHNNNLGLIQGSKNEYAGGTKLAAISADPTKSSLMNDGLFKMLDANNRPLGSAGFVPVNDILNSDLFHAKPLTPSEYLARQKWYASAAGVKDEKRTLIGEDPADNLKDKYRITKDLSADDLMNVGELAGSDFTDPHVQASISNPSPEQVAQLSEIGQRAYGPDWHADTPEKIHKALAIAQVLSASTKEESVVNTERTQAKKAADAVALARTRAALKPPPKAKGQSNHDWIKGQVDDLENVAAQNPKNRVNVTKGGVSEKATILGVPTPVAKVFTVPFNGDNLQPDDFIKFSDGTYAPVIYRRDENLNFIKAPNGGKIVSDKIPIQKISRAQFEAAYGKGISSGNDVTDQLQDDDEEETEAPSPTKTEPSWKTRAKKVN